MQSSWPILGTLACGLLVALATIAGPSGATSGDTRSPEFSSVNKLVSAVETFNTELRQLKRNFMAQITNTYLQLKLHPTLGYEQARNRKAGPAFANILMAEEFATIVIKRHIVQRRLYTGLKLAFIKFLPMQALVKLVQRYESFEWLKNQEQVQLKPKFPGAKGES